MEQRELVVMKREAAGTSAARRLRRQGRIPAILYGRGGESVALTVNAGAMRDLLHGAHSVVLRLRIEDSGEDEPTVMLRDLQRHPLTGEVLNVDFQRISLTEKITAQVPVVLVGDAPGLRQGGVLDQVLREIEVEALPTDLPQQLELDVSGLQIGHSLHVSELSAPAGVTIATEPTEVVATMLVPRVVEVAPAAAVEAPAEEAEEAEETPAEAEEEAE